MADFDIIMPIRNSGDIRDEIFKWNLNRWLKFYPEITPCLGTDDSVSFNRAAARNKAYEQTTSDVIVIADADTIPIPAFINAAVKEAKKGKWCIAYDEAMYFSLTEKKTKQYLSLSPLTEVGIPHECEHQITSWAGMIAVPREAYELVGGYDERFIGWGHEDVAFRLKMDNEFGNHVRVKSGYAVHMWHPRPNATFGTKDELLNRELFDSEYKKKYRWKDERLR